MGAISRQWDALPAACMQLFPTLLHMQPHKRGMGERRWYAGQIAASERGGARRRRRRWSGDLQVFDREQARSLENSCVVLLAGINAAQHNLWLWGRGALGCHTG